jgi:ABC-type multidrug transport system ATPase subunit
MITHGCAEMVAVQSTVVAELVGVRRTFGRRAVIDGLTLSVHAGDRIAVRGPNGSGKTTLLRCVSGLAPVQAGAITVAGHPALSVEARRRVGAVIGSARSLYGRLTGHENLLLFSRLRFREQAARAAVAAVEDELELAEIAGERVDRCSAGMVGQIALARALLGDPPLLALDEPTRSLDADARERLWAALDRRPDAACLIASHRDDDLDRCTYSVDLGD